MTSTQENSAMTDIRIRPKYVTVECASGRGVAERWRSQYQRDGRWTDTVHGDSQDKYARLCALGPAPNIAAVAEIIGNKSWSYLTCGGCSDSVERAVRFGTDYSETTLLCETCIREAMHVLTATP